MNTNNCWFKQIHRNHTITRNRVGRCVKLSTNLLRSAGQIHLYPKSVHKPARVSRSVTLGLTTPKSVHKPARVGRYVTHIRKVFINLPGLAGL